MHEPDFFPAISLFGREDGHFPVPANLPPVAARSGGPGRRTAPARTRLALDGREPRGRLPCGRTGLRLALFVGAMAVAIGPASDCVGEQIPRPADLSWVAARASQADAIDAAIAEASQKFGLPTAWLRAIIRAESGFDPHAVSRAGAMGLLQLMPPTWAEWRVRLGLGADPFDIRDNVIAGAGYLRDLLDQFGVPGFIAAYNAGPGRYAEHLATGRPLPLETRAYLAGLAPIIRTAEPSFPAPTVTADWRRSALFVPPTATASPSTPTALFAVGAATRVRP